MCDLAYLRSEDDKNFRGIKIYIYITHLKQFLHSKHVYICSVYKWEGVGHLSHVSMGGRREYTVIFVPGDSK